MQTTALRKISLSVALLYGLLILQIALVSPVRADDNQFYDAPYYNGMNTPLFMMGTQAQLVAASDAYLSWYSDNGPTRAIFGYDRHNNRLITVGSGPTTVPPVMTGTTIYYVAGSPGKYAINAYDLATGQQATLTGKSDPVTQLSADGDVLVYTSGSGSFGRIISQNQEFQLDLQMPRASALQVSGRFIFWAGRLMTDATEPEYGLEQLNVDSKHLVELIRTNGDFTNLTVSGNVIAWIAHNNTENIEELTLYDWAQKQYTGLGPGGSPSINGSLVAYLSRYTEGQALGYDPNGKRYFLITGAANEVFMYGNKVIWRKDFTNSRGTGRAYYEAIMLPRPDSDTLPSRRIQEAIPNTLFFYETGHSLRGLFQEYWEKHGGLPQFGYPTTEEFDETNPSDGQVHRVQYFERARFEYHPENQPPYNILLGLLGRTVTVGREYEDPFLPLGREQAGGKYFFQEVGHTISGPLQTYWEKTGGLPVYGFPISEPFMEVNPADGKTYLVQYFERNRLEYHPENTGTQYEVQLGLLGNQILKGRGWLNE